jgi:predicted kinase
MSLYNFYRSREWENLLKVLKLERVDAQGNIICEHCGRPIVKAYDCIGHHVIELTEENYTDANISLNPDNIQLVHHKCHNIIHNKLFSGHRQVFIVYGSPLAGKSSYVAEAMAEGDLIIDMDRIWSCVSGCDMYVKPARLKSVVFAVRDNLLESVKYRRGKWLNAYIIGGYPYQAERERLAESLGARLVHIDTPYEECVKRLMECEDRDVKLWEQYISDWWLQYNGGY